MAEKALSVKKNCRMVEKVIDARGGVGPRPSEPDLMGLCGPGIACELAAPRHN